MIVDWAWLTSQGQKKEPLVVMVDFGLTWQQELISRFFGVHCNRSISIKIQRFKKLLVNKYN